MNLVFYANVQQFRVAGTWMVSLVLCTLATGQTLPVERFDRDPTWEGFRNRLLPLVPRITRQDFGFSPATAHSGGQPGEIGGRAQRSTTPAYYAMPIGQKTFDDRLAASGKFAVTRAEGGSGVLFGWFHHASRGWRTANSLVFRLDGNGGRYWVLFEYGTRNYRAGGKGCFEGDAYQTTKTRPLAADGAIHEWSLQYDPAGNNGNGVVTFALDHTPYTLDVRPEDRADGLQLTHFGILNTMIFGDAIEAWFDDVVIDGKEFDFTDDPQWDASGNRVAFEDRVIRPFHDFGYSAETKLAGGGGSGAIGGIVWRDERPAYYAAKTERLSLDDELDASGKLAFTGAGSDSGVCIGWFNSLAKQPSEPESERTSRDALAIMIEGPSRIGHYFRPFYQASTGDGRSLDEGPVIRPDGVVHEWRLRYDPNAAAGRGQVCCRLDDEQRCLDLKPGAKAAGAEFDRFGIFNIQRGGTYVAIYVDDLQFTAAGPQR